MPFTFTDAARYPYQKGGIFLGLDAQNHEVGIGTERHIITIAGSRSGKGAALKVPNLKRWPGSVVDIDPKGESATLTAMDRAAMGQTVGLLDPYQQVKGAAAKFRCSINPLSLLDPASLHFRSDLEALADGLIMRHDPKQETWVRAARILAGGGTDFIMATEPRENWTLPNVLNLFVQPDDVLEVIAGQMLASDTPGRYAKQAGALLLDKLKNPESVPAQTYSSHLLPALSWIGDPAFDSVWRGYPEFDLDTLKNGTGTLYLVLPPKALGPRGAFLRLFVSMALNAMMGDDNEETPARCLFMLDEFYSLGSLDLVAQAMGLMGGFGVSLWPFMHDLGQLRQLYGDNLSGTFFSNTDAQIFFGVTDQPTLGYVSNGIGNTTADELPAFNWQENPLTPQNPGRADWYRMQLEMAGDHERMVNQQVGRPRLTSDQIREIVSKRPGDKVARSMIVFAHGSDVLNLRLAPYFETPPPPAPDVQSAPAAASSPAKASIWATNPARDWMYAAAVALGFMVLAAGPKGEILPAIPASVMFGGVLWWLRASHRRRLARSRG